MKKLRNIIFLTVLGCTGNKVETQDTAEEHLSLPSEGSLLLRFRIDTDYLALMEEEAIGPFYGAFWLGSEVSSVGPDDSAESLGAIYIEEIVLPVDGSPTEVLLLQEDLPAEEVIVLGFMDSDGNADPNAPSPDSKDPVTLPNDNDFDVIGGEETEVTVFFGFLNP